MQAPKQGRYNVWARALWAYLDLAKVADVSLHEAFEGMPFDARTVRTRWSVTWDDFCTLTERLERLCGGPERCRDLLRQSYHEVVPEFRSLLSSMMCPVSFARFALGVISPIVYQGCTFSVLATERHHLRVELRLRPAARPSLTFFRATVGELEALPRHLGLAPALVTAEFSANHGNYDIWLPPPRRNPPIAMDERLPIDPGPRVEAARALWSLTPRQAEVLGHIARGASNKEIASELDCAENTVELHVTKLLHRAGVSSRARLMARFWAGL